MSELIKSGLQYMDNRQFRRHDGIMSSSGPIRTPRTEEVVQKLEEAGLNKDNYTHMDVQDRERVDVIRALNAVNAAKNREVNGNSELLDRGVRIANKAGIPEDIARPVIFEAVKHGIVFSSEAIRATSLALKSGQRDVVRNLYLGMALVEDAGENVVGFTTNAREALTDLNKKRMTNKRIAQQPAFSVGD